MKLPRWAAAVLLFALNAGICWRLFHIEYSQHFASVEGYVIGIARYISTQWGGFSWWSLWHCGMPYQDTYVPLFDLVVAAFAAIAHLPPARAYHEVTAVTYSLGAVSLFLMAERLGASRGAAFVAALIYSVFSPSVLLMPEVTRDIGSWYLGRRLQVLTVYGEGPHITSLAILPLAILALQSALEKRTARSLAWASLAMAAMYLTNVPGTMALGLAVFCWRAVQPPGSRLRAWLTAGAAAVLAYAIACYGVPPSSLGTVVSNVGAMHIGFQSTLKSGPLWLPGLLMVVAGAGFLLKYIELPLFVRFGALYAVMLAAMVLTARPQRFELLPQVGRLHVEMEIAECLLLGGLCWWLYRRSPRWCRHGMATLALACVILQVHNYHHKLHDDLARVNPATRSEYTTARWLDANLHGQRVYAAGSTAFWLNAFTDTPQVVGCCDQGQSMPILRIVPYMISPKVSPEFTRVTVAYLQALGANALIASGPQSTDEYKEIEDPERYGAVMPVLHREHGDIIYGVPRRSASLPHVLSPGDTVPVRGAHEVQQADVLRYAAALQDASRPIADFHWLDADTGRIRATLQAGDVVSVQIPWFHGWRIAANGRPQRTSADGLGFMLIHPACQGDCTLTLTWTGPVDLKWCAGISILAVTLAVCLAAFNPNSSPWARRPEATP